MQRQKSIEPVLPMLALTLPIMTGILTHMQSYCIGLMDELTHAHSLRLGLSFVLTMESLIKNEINVMQSKTCSL